MLTIEHPAEELRARVAGRVVLPGDAGWDEARRAWNLAVDQRPELVAIPERPLDVIEIVRHARRRGLRVAAQGLGILFVTSDLDEVLALSDRILVMANGRISGEFPAGTEAATVIAAATPSFKKDQAA